MMEQLVQLYLELLTLRPSLQNILISISCSVVAIVRTDALTKLLCPQIPF